MAEGNRPAERGSGDRLGFLKDPDLLVRRIILAEVLGPPRGLSRRVGPQGARRGPAPARPKAR